MDTNLWTALAAFVAAVTVLTVVVYLQSDFRKRRKFDKETGRKKLRK